MVTLGDSKYNDKFTLEFAGNTTGLLSIYIRDDEGKRLFKQMEISSRIMEIIVPDTAYNQIRGFHDIEFAWDTNYGAGRVFSSSIFVVAYDKIDFKSSSVLYTGKYSVTVYGADGKIAKKTSVVFYVNGKKVKTVKTDSKGVATFNMPNKYVPGKYTIKAVALGKTASKKVTVKQILTVKKVKIKKSAKKVVITATLKKVNGKYIKGKYLKLKINGKTIKAKTSKKGVAKFIIKKSILKKLKVGKKYTYKVTYLKTTVKKTVKVKK